MHADNTIYTRIKNGIVVVSGTGPAIHIDGKRLVIRDGPLETPPLRLTRAEAHRRLRHIIVVGDYGGYVSFDALRWLRDAGVGFSQLDWNGTVIATSPSPDLPALRRAQVLACSGAIPGAVSAITREILRVKLTGQARVAKMLSSVEGITPKQSLAASAAIAELAAEVARETDISRMLMFEAHAAGFYWQIWEDVPIRFARRNPKRLGPGGRWQPGRPDPWLVFGPRASLLTGQPYRATTPGNAVLNWLYAICQTELTIALLTAGIDPGIGLFHVDMPNRPSLALDGIEALRPYVDLWLFGYLVNSVFANRDFTELRDGEVRLTHPLNAHLAHTAALWRQVCEPVADWLKESFIGAAETSLAYTRRSLNQSSLSGAGAVLREGRSIVSAAQPRHRARGQGVASPERSRQQGRPAVSPLARVLPTLASSSRPAPGSWGPNHWFGRLTDEPVPRICRECGRAMLRIHRVFCSLKCAVYNYRAQNRSSSGQAE